MSEIATVLPIKLFLAYAGLPSSDFERLERLSADLTGTDRTIPDKGGMALLNAYLEPIVIQRLQAPGHNPLSRIFHEPLFDKRITFDVAMTIARDILVAGLDTVSSHLGFIGYHLARNRRHRDLLLDQPHLLPIALDDLLRGYNAVVLGREATENVRLGNVTIKRATRCACRWHFITWMTD